MSREDLVSDIGGGDTTTLKAYSGWHKKVGLGPTGITCEDFYTDDIVLSTVRN